MVPGRLELKVDRLARQGAHSPVRHAESLEPASPAILTRCELPRRARRQGARARVFLWLVTAARTLVRTVGLAAPGEVALAGQASAAFGLGARKSKKRSLRSLRYPQRHARTLSAACAWSCVAGTSPRERAGLELAGQCRQQIDVDVSGPERHISFTSARIPYSRQRCETQAWRREVQTPACCSHTTGTAKSIDTPAPRPRHASARTRGRARRQPWCSCRSTSRPMA